MRDPTGDRRFWPVDVGEFQSKKNLFTELTDEEIRQMWAEAVVLYKKGEPLHLTKELEDQALLHQKEHSEIDERKGLIQKFLDTLLPEDWADMSLYDRQSYIHDDSEMQPEGTIQRNKVCIPEIWCELFRKSKADMSSYSAKDLRSLMKNMEGWQTITTGGGVADFGEYGRQRGYRRI